ncbi:MAG: rhodanese-like domain-containing protein [Firmicutes bacterium]|nr:rhodanese-like domain-containing protein [Bacillota bacterium]
MFGADTAHSITAEEVATQLETGEKIQIIDVRQPSEYRQGHIPGARLVPLSELNAQWSKLKRDETYVMVCRSGARSQQATQFLLSKGFSNVKNMRGGMLAWRGPVQK